MLKPRKRIADIVCLHMERIRDAEGRPMTHREVAAALKLSVAQVASARGGRSSDAAMKIIQAGGASPSEIAEVAYLAGRRAFPQVTP